MGKKAKEQNIQDPGVERAVLSSILEYGSDMLLDIIDILEAKDFASPSNKKIFSILKYMVTEKECSEFDIPTILSTAKSIGYDEIFQENKMVEYLEALFIGAPSKENAIKMAACLYKMSFARQAIETLRKSAINLQKTTGEEKLDDLISLLEDPIFEFTSQVVSGGKKQLQQIGDSYKEEMEALASDPKDIVGLPTGFDRWDHAIGGGLRRGSVNVVGARAKVGKSFFCLNVAYNMAKNNIPVLYLDTELTKKEQMHRLTSNITNVELEKVENGKFKYTDEEANAIWKAEQEIKHLPLIHCSIAGQSVNSIITIARRWLAQNVGRNDNGESNPCLIIYDYIKVMDVKDLSGKLQEYQMLGFLTSMLHNFAVKWSLPILASVQLNRDGIDKEGGQFVGGSDRILWLCTSLTTLKRKDTNDFQHDPHKNGTHKLVVTDTRFGPGLPEGEYINIHDNRQFGRFEEGTTYGEYIQKSMINEEIH